ncbi:MAG: M20 family metallopeptidase [Acidobacteriota bacterium]|nr:M20 family metallopeptidase [Acidobacteriota bacterium]
MAHSDLIPTLANLIRIASVNSAYNPEGSESEIQNWISDFFRDRGILTWEQEVLPSRPNVIAQLPGKNSARRLLFEAHCDTAGVDGMSIPPFDPRIRNGRIYGRGACDTKAGLAAMMHAMVDLKQAHVQPPCEVWVASTVDEEHSFRGVLKLSENLKAAAAVVSEPTTMRMAIASKGCLRWRITVKGKAAHSSKPCLGTNAIEHMARIVRLLGDDGQQLHEFRHALVGSPTLNIGLIQGGTQVNVVPETCWIEIDRRLIPGEEPAQVLASYRELLNDLRASNPDLEWFMEPPLLQDQPMQTPADSAIAQRAALVLKEAGLDDSPVGVPFGSDASKFARAGIPSIILGPGSIEQAHTADEYVELEEVEKAFVVYRNLMKSFE